MKISRRNFLAGAGALGAASLVPGLGLHRSYAQAADYRALVCVYLYGGNDGNNTIIPLGANEYAAYSAVRGPGGIAIQQGDVVPLAEATETRFGLHPALAPLAPIWNANAMALMFNVGPLPRRLTRAEYLARALRPENLFSHDDQTRQWQAAAYAGDIDLGWGGKLADRLRAMNTGSTIPMNMSVGGNDVFLVGETVGQFGVPTGGTIGLRGFGTNAAQNPRYVAMQALHDLDRANTIVKATQDMMKGAISASAVLNGVVNNSASAAAPAFSNLNTGIARQLFTVAKLIEGRAQTGLKRQVFFVSQGGYDNHSNQAGDHNARLAELGAALRAFYDATTTLGVASQVTAFTMSEFGRTFRPNDGGTDHAWGNHQIVIGGSVRGRQTYGTFPTLQLGGADDSGNEGRWIPTTSVDQFGAALGRWMGVADAELAAIFPSLANFGGVAGIPAFMG